MAIMSAAQTAAELQRRKNLGVAPTNTANMAQFNQLKPVAPQAAPKPATGGIAPPMAGFGGIGAGNAMVNRNPVPAMPQPMPNNAPVTPQGVPGPMPNQNTANFSQGVQSYGAPSTTPSGGVVPGFFDRNFGGRPKYETDQGNRYLSAAASGDADLLGRLEADAKRVGYALPPLPQQQAQASVEQTPMPPVNTPQGYAAPTYTPPVNMNQYQPLTREQIAHEAASKIAAETQRRTTAANQAKQGINTSYDRLRTTVGEDRTLQNVAMQDRLDPFNKHSDFERGMVTMQRERTDREQQQDLESRLANIDVTLKDYMDATPEQQRAMENELTRQERDYGLQVDNQAYGQYADQRDFGRGVYQNDRNFGYQQIRDAVGDSHWEQEFSWNKDERNPAVKLQTWNANLAKQQAMNYPEQVKRDIAVIDQQLKAGQIDIDMAQYNFKELTDPNSITNKRNKLALDLDQLTVSNTATQNSLEVQKLRKQISEIGKTPAKTNLQQKQEELKLAEVEDKLDKLKNPPVKDLTTNQIVAEAVTALDGMSAQERKAFFKGEKANIIAKIGKPQYENLYGDYFDESGDPIE